MGFHAPQEAARILAESIDYARRAQAMAQALRTPAAPASTQPIDPVQGVTPANQAPAGPYLQPNNQNRNTDPPGRGGGP